MLQQIDKETFYKKHANKSKCYLSVVKLCGKYHTIFIHKENNHVFGVEVGGNYFVVRKNYKLNRYFVCNNLLHVTLLNTVCFLDH